MLYKACQFVHTFDAEAAAALPPLDNKAKSQDKNKRAFIDNFLKVCQLNDAFKKDLAADPMFLEKHKGTIYLKMIAPILTRWWTVGSVASYAFDFYLQMLHACQQVINICNSTATPNAIASDSHAMLKDQENFIDVALIRSFNKAYINPHLDWLQSSIDLSGALGFQAHDIAARCFLMGEDLRNTMTHPAMKQCLALSSKCSAEDQARHIKKANVFYSEARDSLHKHFRRWLKTDLLPAALLSESPTAQAVAACMLDRPLPTFHDHVDHVVTHIAGADKHTFDSPVHKRKRFDLSRFYNWLKTELIGTREMDDGVAECSQKDWDAATLIVNSVVVHLRSKDHSTDHGDVRLHMHSTCLPLASQTQFVESAVKEAKLAASTDRSEQIRSCIAIIRSPTPLGKAEKNANVEKIKAIIDSALGRSAAHSFWRRHQVGMEHGAHFNQMLHALTAQGHFAQERTEAKRNQLEEVGVKHKKQNKSQQTKQQHLMPAITGLIPFGKLFAAKDGHVNDLKTELLFRDVPEEETPASITERKEILKLLELERLQWDEDMDEPKAKAQANKCFKRLSNAPFKVD